HFYKVLRKSLQVKFHISLLNKCWYNDLKLSITNEELALLNVCGGQAYTEKLQNIVSVKAKYGRNFKTTWARYLSEGETAKQIRSKHS
ncbi:17032_t:CDS:2, partial [Funneliformis geosporum]